MHTTVFERGNAREVPVPRNDSGVADRGGEVADSLSGYGCDVWALVLLR